MFIRQNIVPFIAGIIHPDYLYRLVKPVIIHPFYHTISDEYLPHIHPLYKPKDVKGFEKDIDFIISFFKAKSIHEVFFCMQKPEMLKENAFHLSFDDGLRGVYETALPLLLQKGIPATIFVNADFVDNRRLFYRHKIAILIDNLNKRNVSKPLQTAIATRLGEDFPRKQSLQSNIRSIPYSQKDSLNDIALLLDVDFQEYLKQNKPYLTTSELKEMQGKGFTIGAHSIDHPPFAELDESEQIRQTVDSCRYVKEIFQESNVYFSFPFSDEGIQDSFFQSIKNTIDLSFGITGIHFQQGDKHIGRIDMEKNGRNAREIINKAFIKYRLKQTV
jgi:peptidoglycan/xylan/chitin deacetylase (PgdA/CDA1 family)